MTCGARFALLSGKDYVYALSLSYANLYLYMQVSLMARLYAHVANIHLYLAMLVGLQNIGGVLILVVVHLYSSAKVNCAHS